MNNAADVVVEVPNEGFDSVITSLSYDLSANAANVEALYLTGSGLTGTGNSDANTLVNAGANTLTGGDGNEPSCSPPAAPTARPLPTSTATR